MKAPDVNVFFSRAPKVQSPTGVWGHAPAGNFSNRILRNAISSVSGTKETVS